MPPPVSRRSAGGAARLTASCAAPSQTACRVRSSRTIATLRCAEALGQR
jgi:hypothetical protein